MQPNVSAYLQSWSAELLSRADRVRQLIGDAHWLSDGHHKEELLREFLRRYLPSELNVSRGFVKNSADLAICSTEVDILITDIKLCPPFFNEGGLQIVDAASVVAHLEVKTSFAKPALKDAIQSTCNITRIVEMRRAIGSTWSAVVFYYGYQEAISVLDTLESVILEISKEAATNGWLALLSFPKAITIIGRFAIFISRQENDVVDCRLFDIERLSLACVFIDMFGHIRHAGGGASFGGLDDAIEALSTIAPVRRLIKI